MNRAERETERLLDAIRSAGVPVAAGTRFQQTRASHSQRMEGGAVWVLVDEEGRPASPHVCSQWPRRLLIRGPISAWQDRLGEWHIDPELIT